VKLLVIGAGGHAKVVIDAARAAGFNVVAAVGNADGVRAVLGVPVLPDAEGTQADCFIVAVGDNRERATLFAEYASRGLAPHTVIHPSATIAPSATVGDGAFLAAGVVVNPDAVIGANVILNTGCTVDHDCTIGEHAHVGPGANLCGSVTIGEGTLVGVGASAMPGVSVGAWTVIGAGATVTGDLPAASVCVGTPARPMKPAGDGS
jgi:UDP-perosamine 4-acetyltransferase